MKTIKTTMFLLATILFLGCNNNKKSVSKTDTPKTVTSLQKKQDSPNNKILKDASSPYEDLVEFALAKNTAEIDNTISKIQADESKVLSVLGETKQTFID